MSKCHSLQWMYDFSGTGVKTSSNYRSHVGKKNLYFSMVHKNVWNQPLSKKQRDFKMSQPSCSENMVCFLKWKNPLSIESHVANAGSSSNGYIIATVERNFKRTVAGNWCFDNVRLDEGCFPSHLTKHFLESLRKIWKLLNFPKTNQR